MPRHRSSRHALTSCVCERSTSSFPWSFSFYYCYTPTVLTTSGVTTRVSRSSRSKQAPGISNGHRWTLHWSRGRRFSFIHGQNPLMVTQTSLLAMSSPARGSVRNQGLRRRASKRGSHHVSPFVYGSQGPPMRKSFSPWMVKLTKAMVASRAIRAGELLMRPTNSGRSHSSAAFFDCAMIRASMVHERRWRAWNSNAPHASTRMGVRGAEVIQAGHAAMWRGRS